jgi:putative heme-binding domain-containing protein
VRLCTNSIARGTTGCRHRDRTNKRAFRRCRERKKLVESSKCSDCHRIGERGSRVGPDLSDIGSRRSSAQLRQALVAPDSEVLPQHRSVRLVTKDGTSVIGRLLNLDAFSIQLMTTDEQLKSYLRSNLREHTILEKGQIPCSGRRTTAI